ncbi:hypothetical protein SprV_0301154100 [Sparganum proliferum]
MDLPSGKSSGIILDLPCFTRGSYAIDWLLGKALHDFDGFEFSLGRGLADFDVADNVAMPASTSGDLQSGATGEGSH